jgi:hypothetical protein
MSWRSQNAYACRKAAMERIEEAMEERDPYKLSDAIDDLIDAKLIMQAEEGDA